LIGLIAARPSLVTSLGLHLSVAATLGIVLWSARVAARLRPLPRPIAALIGATLAAQIAVSPLLAGVFGQLSVAGVAANLLAVPAVAPATVLGLAGGVVGSMAPAAGEVIVRPTGPLLSWILGVADLLGSQGWAALEVPTWAGWVLGAPVAVAAMRSAHRVATGG
jgi:competence protein ComEC